MDRSQTALLKIYEKKSDIIKYALDKNDPMGLIAMGCPADEYLPEVGEIQNKINASERPSFYAVRKIVCDTLSDKFDAAPNKKLCGKIATDILSGFSLLDLYADLSEADILKDRIDIVDNKLRLTVHDNFIAEYCWTYRRETITVNGKPYYCDIEEQDVSEAMCGFCTADNVYVQYKRKRFFPFWYALFNRSYFLCIQKNKFDIQKLKYKDDIELIFDRNGVISIS